MKPLRRSIAALVVGGSAALPAQALAVPVPVDPTPQVFPAGVFCPFPLELRLAGKTDEIQLPDDSTLITSPGQTATMTNLDSGRRVTVNITGSFLNLPPAADGSVRTLARGRNLLGDPDAGLVIAVGDFSFVTAADGTNLVRLSGTGTLTSVCSLLA
jgi:hypothetical protein